MTAGKPSPITGFAVDADGFLSLIQNDLDVRRWVRQAMNRIETYEQDRKANE